MNGLCSYLRRAALSPDAAGLADGQLLESFVARRDEAAFEALVRRHGPMVMGVCRRVLHHEQDAEDAFQATFLVLARKAARLLPRDRLANWLYGVAYYAALKARAATLKRRAKESQAAFTPRATLPGLDDLLDLQSLLDQELSRLPDKYREPVVLCELEGKSRKEVAGLLGIPQGTLSSRLATARRMLAKRLSRHGVPAVGAAVAALAPLSASAGPEAALVTATVRAAGLLVARAGGVSARVVALMEGVLRMMFLSKLKVAGAVLLVVGLVCAGGAGVIHCATVEGLPRPGQATPPPAESSGPQASAARYDRLWADLASPDQTKATGAALALATTPQKTLALFRERLGPVKADPPRVARLLADLDAEEFARRERASEELEYLEHYARPALEKALTGDLTPEARRRMQRLLDRLNARAPIVAGAATAAPTRRRASTAVGASAPAWVGPQASTTIKAGSGTEATPAGGGEGASAPGSSNPWLRAARAIAVLEHIATPEAQKLLQLLADGEPDAIPTREARAALKRLGAAPPAP
jgi:RNA polymerase sigma factor (sigma-70 family)